MKASDKAVIIPTENPLPPLSLVAGVAVLCSDDPADAGFSTASPSIVSVDGFFAFGVILHCPCLSGLYDFPGDPPKSRLPEYGFVMVFC